MLTSEAPNVWNVLKGILCVYKPADVPCKRVVNTVIHKICTELNEMNCRPPIDYVSIEGDPSQGLTVITKPSLADDPLVVGPRYQPRDIRCTWSTYLGRNTSGVLLLGIRDGTRTVMQIRSNKLLRAYRVKGHLGLATDNYYKDGKVVEKSTFKSIKPFHLEKLLSGIQAAHQRQMFEICGVEIQSQAAYELAIKGPIRPGHSKTPLIYGIKCVHFEPPDFTIEVHCINEYEMYLKTLIHDIGIKLHSAAHCTGIQCIRHSHFTLDHSLLQKHWTLQNIVSNMETCNSLIEKHRDLIGQENVALQYRQT